MLSLKVCKRCCKGTAWAFSEDKHRWAVTNSEGAIEFQCPDNVGGTHNDWDARKPPPPWCPYDLAHMIETMRRKDRTKRRHRYICK